MKTPIKSFEIIKEMYEYFVKKYRDLEPKLMICEKEDFDNVETALKDYELLKERTKLDSFECLLRLELILPRGKELLIPVAKQLKALEIIKNKEVDVSWFKYCLESCENDTNAIKQYNKNCDIQITVEEYDLLKEVLK